MNVRYSLFILCLLLASVAVAGRSREEMGVKFNPKKPPVTQAAPAQQPPSKQDTAKDESTDVHPQANTLDTPKADEKPSN